MIVAVIADIHGNDVAMEAVAKQMIKAKVEKVWVLGDIVGYYYHPERVLDTLSSWNCEIIKGNHEKMMDLATRDKKYLHEVTQKYGHGIEKAIVHLNKKQVNLLGTLPENKLIKLGNLSVKICHGSSWDNDFRVYPDTAKQILERNFTPESDYVFLGHTHYSFIYQRVGKVLVNPGSVGQARDFGGLANWVLFNTTSKVIIFKSTVYDRTELIKEIRNNDPQIKYLQDVLYRE